MPKNHLALEPLLDKSNNSTERLEEIVIDDLEDKPIAVTLNNVEKKPTPKIYPAILFLICQHLENNFKDILSLGSVNRQYRHWIFYSDLTKNINTPFFFMCPKNYTKTTYQATRQELLDSIKGYEKIKKYIINGEVDEIKKIVKNQIKNKYNLKIDTLCLGVTAVIGGIVLASMLSLTDSSETSSWIGLAILDIPGGLSLVTSALTQMNLLDKVFLTDKNIITASYFKNNYVRSSRSISFFRSNTILPVNEKGKLLATDHNGKLLAR